MFLPPNFTIVDSIGALWKNDLRKVAKRALGMVSLC